MPRPLQPYLEPAHFTVRQAELTVQTNLLARRSRVNDPTTGERRRISEDMPFEVRSRSRTT